MQRIVVLALLGFFGLAQAQTFSLGGSLSASAGSGSATTLEASLLLTAGDLLRAGPLGLDARAEANLLVTDSLGFSVGLAALATLGLEAFTAYAGPQVNVGIVPSGFTLGAVAGARYAIAPRAQAFGEVNFLFTQPLAWRLRAGVQFGF
ncbi:hypothetical protein [Calidithermus chliarophilus]|uniref:hypothetical protein n=1 Tax=Calidithermus chliarophilus TaxID=52023 RepID=UPI0003FAA80B|nr:hypothetical protein [Calidithermus chliarophilus]